MKAIFVSIFALSLPLAAYSAQPATPGASQQLPATAASPQLPAAAKDHANDAALSHAKVRAYQGRALKMSTCREQARLAGMHDEAAKTAIAACMNV